MLADRLVISIYSATRNFPRSETYGLQAQLRRSAVSAAVNIVEGSARESTAEYRNFLNIAAGSASETRYLADLAYRLGFLEKEPADRLQRGYAELAGGLGALMKALPRHERPPEP